MLLLLLFNALVVLVEVVAGALVVPLPLGLLPFGTEGELDRFDMSDEAAAAAVVESFSLTRPFKRDPMIPVVIVVVVVPFVSGR